MSKEKQKSILKKIRQNLEDNITKIENRTDINDDEKVLRIVKAFSATCAAIATQPIPGWDIFPLTAIQAYMGSRVASIRGIPISESKTGEIIKEILGVVGLGMLGQNFVLTATGNITLANPSTETVGQTGFIAIIQDGTGSRTLTLGTDYESPASGGITLTTTANATDVLPYVVIAANRVALGTPQLAFG